MKEIRRIIEAFDQLDHQTEKVALASVVNVEESSYRRIGARMLVSSSGIWVGGISGGCLEGDALKRSQKAIYNNKASLVVYDTLDADEHQIGIGLGCNGRIEVLFTPIDPKDSNNPIEQLRSVVHSSEPKIMLKVIETNDDKIPLGKSMLLQNESTLDFLGIDKTILHSCISETRKKRKPGILETSLSSGTQLKILAEYLRPEIRLVIVGDNYDINATIGLAKELGWEIFLVGKPKKMSKYAFNSAAKVFTYEQIDDIPVHEYTSIVLMTHDYNLDKKLLPDFMELEVPYLGMLGPQKRMLRLQDELGLDLESRTNFFSPVGLDIGAETPEEIALSITGEIIATFRDRSGHSLKFRKGTIHERE